MPNSIQTSTTDSPGIAPRKTFVDAHVHIHDCFDVDAFFDATAANFDAVSSNLRSNGDTNFILCLTETFGTSKFTELKERANAGDSQKSGWTFRAGDEQECVVATHPRHSDITVVAGRQIVTAERLEILALGLVDAPPDGLPISDVIRTVLEADAIPVLPWGFGKWLGARRDVVNNTIKEFVDTHLFLGDNSGRPGILPVPPEFGAAAENGMRILPGTDPLPFATEFDRAGSFGLYVDDVSERNGLWNGLRQMLQRGDGELHQYGNLESPFRFIRNQIAMQVKMRLRDDTR